MNNYGILNQVNPLRFENREIKVLAFFGIIFVGILHFGLGYQYGMNLVWIILFSILLIKKDSKQIFRDWFIPILLFYIYEVTRANAYQFAVRFDRPLIFEVLIDLELSLFGINGEIPTSYLQRLMEPNISTPRFYDYILFAIYNVFFMIWVVTAVIFYNFKKSLFNKYVYGLIAFSLSAVVIYALYPTAPPWYAYENGLIENSERILWKFEYFGRPSIEDVNEYGQNLFAAIPSLHAGWSFFAGLYLTKAFGWKGSVGILISFLIAFATWYGGEHYIIDSLAGFLMASFFFIVSLNWERVRRLKINN